MVIKVMSLTTRNLLAEGSRKVVYQGANNDRVILSYKDCTPFLVNSGVLWNLVNEQLFSMLQSCSIPNHFIKRINLREQEVYNASSFPFQVRITNLVTEQLNAVLDMEIGTVLKRPIIEFVVEKNKTKHVIEQAYLAMFDWCKSEHLEKIKQTALRVNDALQAFFFQHSMHLSHCYLKFGLFTPEYVFDTNVTEDIMLIDDLTPHYSFALWCKKENRMMPLDFQFVSSLAEYMKLSLNHCIPADPSNNHSDNT